MKKSILAAAIVSVIALNANASIVETVAFETEGQSVAVLPASEIVVYDVERGGRAGEPTTAETYADSSAVQDVFFETESQRTAPESFPAQVVYDVERGGRAGEPTTAETYADSSAVQDVFFETEGQHTAPESFPAQVVYDVERAVPVTSRTTPDAESVTYVQTRGTLRNGQAMANVTTPGAVETHAVADVANNAAPNESVAHLNRFSMRGNFDEHTAEGIQNIAHNPLLSGTDVQQKANAILERVAAEELAEAETARRASIQAQGRATRAGASAIPVATGPTPAQLAYQDALRKSIANYLTANPTATPAQANAAASADPAVQAAYAPVAAAKAAAAATPVGTTAPAATTLAATAAPTVAAAPDNNERFAALKSEIDNNRDEANAGIAGVAAMANIPQVSQGSTLSVGAGVGNFKGEQGLAVGASARLGQNVVTKLSVSATTQHDFVSGAGLSYEW